MPGRGWRTTRGGGLRAQPAGVGARSHPRGPAPRCVRCRSEAAKCDAEDCHRRPARLRLQGACQAGRVERPCRLCRLRTARAPTGCSPSHLCTPFLLPARLPLQIGDFGLSQVLLDEQTSVNASNWCAGRGGARRQAARLAGLLAQSCGVASLAAPCTDPRTPPTLACPQRDSGLRRSRAAHHRPPEQGCRQLRVWAAALPGHHRAGALPGHGPSADTVAGGAAGAPPPDPRRLPAPAGRPGPALLERRPAGQVRGHRVRCPAPDQPASPCAVQSILRPSGRPHPSTSPASLPCPCRACRPTATQIIEELIDYSAAYSHAARVSGPAAASGAGAPAV